MVAISLKSGAVISRKLLLIATRYLSRLQVEKPIFGKHGEAIREALALDKPFLALEKPFLISLREAIFGKHGWRNRLARCAFHH